MSRLFRIFILFVALALLPLSAMAADQPPKADPALVSTLFPDYQMVQGIHTNSIMRLIMEKENGDRVFIGCTQDVSGSWHCVESTPLPEGTILGVENFVTSLGIKGSQYYHAVTLSPFHDGTWGVTLMYPEGDQSLIIMGQNWISTDYVRTNAVFGIHKWNDITTIDWASLPTCAEDAVPESAGTWAMVRNPDPNDRLNLRTEPNTASRTRGKYYSGTPVNVLSGMGTGFVQVDILGVTGWMKEEFISYETSTAVIPMAGPQLHVKGDALRVYEQTDTSAPSVLMDGSNGADFVVIGVVGNTWYHVWYPVLGFGGYVLQSDLWEGNG